MSQRTLTELAAEFRNGLTPQARLHFDANPNAFQPAVDAYVARLTPQEGFGLMGEDLELYTVMLAFTEQAATVAADICANGTGSLIDTGTAKLLVTNHHVYDNLSKLRHKHPESRMLMSGDHGVNFHDISDARVVDLDDQRDLAVLTIPESHVTCVGKQFYKCPSWPPPRPEVGMKVLIYGYPGQGRVPRGNVLGAHPILMILKVEDVSWGSFAVAYNREDGSWTVPAGARPLGNLGGMSGSAVYVEQPAGALALVGFVSEEMYDEEGSPRGLVLVRYADCINADGVIRGR